MTTIPSDFPRIAFCITCKGRSHHLKKTLPQNILDNEGYPNAVFIVLNYGSPDDLMDYMKTVQAENIRRGKVVVYTFDTDGPFQMAHAKNMAHRLGILNGADILVNLDADNITNHAFSQYVVRTYREFGPNTFMWAKMLPSILPRGISGRIVVTTDAFLRLGGYDEKFNIWSPDDKDFNQRLVRSGVVPIEINSYYLNGLRHTDKVRFKEYPHAKDLCDYESEIIEDGADNTVVNFGKFGMGTVTKNFDCEEIVLGPLPTRVFGIGMHKTGTTSLSNALNILGFSSAHWITPRWARDIWEEMKTGGRSLTLEQYQAVTDLPMTILYKELDLAYPGSKFILTVRDEDVWLNSVERHWSHEFNKWRADWKRDCFTHRVHREVYGQQGFDGDVFLNRYRQHNSEVFEYFKNRPNDLCVLHVKHNIQWDGLCKFLNKSVPTIEFPKINTTPIVRSSNS